MSEQESLEQLATIIVELEWLGKVYMVQTDPSDSDKLSI